MRRTSGAVGGAPKRSFIAHAAKLGNVPKKSEVQKRSIFSSREKRASGGSTIDVLAQRTDDILSEIISMGYHQGRMVTCNIISVRSRVETSSEA